MFHDLLEVLGQTDRPPPDGTSSVYAACRCTRKETTWLTEAWMGSLSLGRPLPTQPLWLADDLAIPLDLESTYEETCRILRLPRPCTYPGIADESAWGASSDQGGCKEVAVSSGPANCPRTPGRGVSGRPPDRVYMLPLALGV